MALLNPAGHVAIASVRVAGFAECYHLGISQYARLLTQYPNFKNYIEMVAKLRATATAHGARRAAGEMVSSAAEAGTGTHDSFQQHRHHYADETRSLGQLFEVLNPHARQMRRKSAYVREQERRKSMQPTDLNFVGDRRKSRKVSTRWNKMLCPRTHAGFEQHSQASRHEGPIRELGSFGHSVLGRTGNSSQRRESLNSLASDSQWRPASLREGQQELSTLTV